MAMGIKVIGEMGLPAVTTKGRQEIRTVARLAQGNTATATSKADFDAAIVEMPRATTSG
jgi:hypothetical protein